MNRKIASLLFSGILASGVVFTACNKEAPSNTASNTVVQDRQKPSVGPLSRITDADQPPVLSDRGYLRFESMNHYNAFMDHLVTSTYDELIQYYSEMGFSSLAGNQHAGLPPGTPLADDDVAGYIFDQNGLVEIQGTVFKYNAGDDFFLTTQAATINDAIHTQMTNNDFDPSVMNRFATYRPETEPNIFDVIQNTPYGHDDPNPNPPVAGFKLFGKKHTETPVTNGAGTVLYTWCCNTYYVFGIAFGPYCDPC